VELPLGESIIQPALLNHDCGWSDAVEYRGAPLIDVTSEPAETIVVSVLTNTAYLLDCTRMRLRSLPEREQIHAIAFQSRKIPAWQRRKLDELHDCFPDGWIEGSGDWIGNETEPLSIITTDQ